MKTELMISWRYLATKRKEKFVSLISILSVAGIAIGVMALILVIGVMNGFDNELRDKIVGNFAHVVVSGYNGMSNADADKAVKKISLNPHVLATSAYLQGQVFVQQESFLFAADLKGIEPKQEAAVTKISQYLVSGNIQDLSGESVIVGKELASYLGLGLNSQLNIYSPRGLPRKLKVAGIFNSGMYEYDFKLILVPLATAQDILGAQGKITGIAVKLDNIYLADKVRSDLARVLGPNFFIKTWMQLNENFFAALKLEKITMFIILTLIILVAAFNIASTLIVMVVEKTKDIGILKAIGATSKRVRKIFIYEGLMIGIAGTFLGVTAGIFLAYLLKRYQFIKLPAIYSIENLPVSIVFWPDMALIILAAMFITLVSTIYPASKAGKLKPVEALRYE